MKFFSHKSGFTLVEIMVAVSIFAVVAVIATGALVTASDINRKAQAIKLAVDNVNFALNKMTFEIKTGEHYTCGTNGIVNGQDFGDQIDPSYDCTNGGDTLFLFTYRGDDCDNYFSSCGDTEDNIPVAYKFDASSGSILYSTNPLEITPTYNPVTSDSVEITSLVFYVLQSQYPPRVKISLTGIAAQGTKYETKFELQTTAISRD